MLEDLEQHVGGDFHVPGVHPVVGIGRVLEELVEHVLQRGRPVAIAQNLHLQHKQSNVIDFS